VQVGVVVRLGAAEPDALLRDLVLGPGHEALRPAGVHARRTGSVLHDSADVRRRAARAQRWWAANSSCSSARRGHKARRPTVWPLLGTRARGPAAHGRARLVQHLDGARGLERAALGARAQLARNVVTAPTSPPTTQKPKVYRVPTYRHAASLRCPSACSCPPVRTAATRRQPARRLRSKVKIF
jgi:hypothetical protein